MSVSYSLAAMGVSSALEPFSIGIGQRAHSPLLLARVARSRCGNNARENMCLAESHAAI